MHLFEGSVRKVWRETLVHVETNPASPKNGTSTRRHLPRAGVDFPNLGMAEFVPGNCLASPSIMIQEMFLGCGKSPASNERK